MRSASFLSYGHHLPSRWRRQTWPGNVWSGHLGIAGLKIGQWNRIGVMTGGGYDGGPLGMYSGGVSLYGEVLLIVYAIILCANHHPPDIFPNITHQRHILVCTTLSEPIWSGIRLGAVNYIVCIFANNNRSITHTLQRVILINRIYYPFVWFLRFRINHFLQSNDEHWFCATMGMIN